MKRRSLTLRTITGLTLTIAVFTLAACEAAVTGTPTPNPPTATPSDSADSESTATPITTLQPTVVSRTPTSGGRGGVVPPVQPTATQSTGRGATTGSGGASSSPLLAISDLSQFEGASLIGEGNADLGVFEPTDRALNSLCDNIAGGGAAFGANSILNDLSPFGGKFGANSPFNPESATPPQIVLQGQLIGHLTVSPFIDSAVDPFAVLSWLGCPVDANR